MKKTIFYLLFVCFTYCFLSCKAQTKDKITDIEGIYKLKDNKESYLFLHKIGGDKYFAQFSDTLSIPCSNDTNYGILKQEKDTLNLLNTRFFGVEIFLYLRNDSIFIKDKHKYFKNSSNYEGGYYKIGEINPLIQTAFYDKKLYYNRCKMVEPIDLELFKYPINNGNVLEKIQLKKGAEVDVLAEVYDCKNDGFHQNRFLYVEILKSKKQGWVLRNSFSPKAANIYIIKGGEKYIKD